MKSREFKKMYHSPLRRYVYEHRGNGLIVDNIIKPLKSGIKAVISSAANKAGKFVAEKLAEKFGKKAYKTTKSAKSKVAEKLGTKSVIPRVAENSGDIIRKRLANVPTPQAMPVKSQPYKTKSMGK